MTIRAALYARVSSEKQAQAGTIDSQISAIVDRINSDGLNLINDFKFIDNGYSGSNLIRPALEKLRDNIANSDIDKVYIHSPDRLSRKYAYQMILMEEFQRAGTEVIFLNHQTSDNPESHLLLQMQGMIAEYERSKIIERNRRGKIHGAKKGSINVLSGAPYGYRYINKNFTSGQAMYEINFEEAEIVKQIFQWVGRNRLSIGEVCRRLNKIHPRTRKGNTYWDRSTIWSILKNPAYKGTAAFGKTKTTKKLPLIRPKKNSTEQLKRCFSQLPEKKEQWIYIPVPAIVEVNLFENVQEQLLENKKISRAHMKGSNYLLQGLILCFCCKYAYYAKCISKISSRGKSRDYFYYRCTGTDKYRFGGNKICNNKQIRSDVIEIAVWEEVKNLLKNPNRLLTEFERRINEIDKSPSETSKFSLEKEKTRLNKGISRLIDSYAQDYISKDEFEPRIKSMKQHLKVIEDQQNKLIDQEKLKYDLKLIITNLENFRSEVESKLEKIDWNIKRDIIRTLVKRIEINMDDVNIVFRINGLENTGNSDVEQKSLQHCRDGRNYLYWCYK